MAARNIQAVDINTQQLSLYDYIFMDEWNVKVKKF